MTVAYAEMGKRIDKELAQQEYVFFLFDQPRRLDFCVWNSEFTHIRKGRSKKTFRAKTKENAQEFIISTSTLNGNWTNEEENHVRCTKVLVMKGVHLKKCSYNEYFIYMVRTRKSKYNTDFEIDAFMKVITENQSP